jgi:hypothetical protein
MKSAPASPAARTIGRIRQIWAELDYAQRRLFEIQTGLRLRTPQGRRGSRFMNR